MKILRIAVLALLVSLFCSVNAFAQTKLSSGTCPGTGCATFSTNGLGGLALHVTGTFNGTISVFGGLDNADFSNAIRLTPSNGGPIVTTVTGTGLWSGPVTGFTYVRVQFTNYVSGTAVLNIAMSPTASSTVDAIVTPQIAASSALTPTTFATLTTSTNVKTSPGNVYGVYALNGAASTCWIQFINSAGAGTLGTGVIFSVPLPASTTQSVYLQPSPLALANFSTGIAVGIATTQTGNVACGTAGTVVVFSR